ncbi:MAG: response regulator [Acidobacteria bacterium]|nr:response regulator [Acidobacteriota bacterium]MCA1620604.1 response regulator [Acidobacteriota bacterium]
MTKTRQDEETLLNAALLRWMNDLAGQGILITDADLKIRAWNRWLEEHSELTAAEVLGRNLLDVYTVLETRRLDRHYKWVLEGQTRILSQRLHGHLLPLPTKAGMSGFTEMQQTARISPLIADDGRVIGTLTVIDDVTERVTREAELQAQVDARTQALAREKAAREEAEEANRLKDEFLATVSHELRTPLTSILGWSNMLLAGRLEGAAHDRALDIIHRNAQSQNQLISDLLDVSRIISGKLRLDLRTVELPTVIEAAVEATRPAAEAKGVRLTTTLDPRSGPISGDADRLQQVVWNLLSNAIKFTDAGGEIEVRLGSVNSRVEITVRDSGIGIDPEFLPHIFDRFRQADPATNRMHGGMGLGLSIVRQLVELHGGTVRAESGGEGKGATFTVSLPFVDFRGGPERAERLPPNAVGHPELDCPPSLQGLRVLAVDDEEDTREMIRAVLEHCKMEVITAASVPEALDAIAKSRPDVLLSDLGMPGEDGYVLIAKVRALPLERGGQIPAAALTAYVRAEDRVRVLSSGYQLHVPKPLEPNELVAVVANLAGRLPE